MTGKIAEIKVEPPAVGRIDPSFAVAPNQVEAIAVESFSTMNRIGAKAVLAQSYSVAKREGLSFHVSYADWDNAESGGTGSSRRRCASSAVADTTRLGRGRFG